MRRLVFLLVLFVAFAAPAQAETRVALVIGNAAYKHVPALSNPRNDAEDLAKALSNLGFSVTTAFDKTYSEMRRALQSFGRASAEADVALLYYAGHGIEVDNRNFLIPVDAALKSDRDVDFEAVDMSLLMRAVEPAKRLRVVVLDACRDNPFAQSMSRGSGTRSIGRGLARVEPIGDTLVAYAAKAGSVAADGKGRNSPYAKALLRHLAEPGLEIGFMFRKVRDAVLESTSGRQEPFVYGSLSSEGFYFKPLAAKPDIDPKPAEPAYGGSNPEIVYWQSIKDSDDADLYRAYLEQFPSGVFASLARLKLSKFESAAADAAAWRKARRRNSIASYKRYLDGQPNGAYRNDASELIERLNTAAENRAWQVAEAAGSIKQYQAFLKAHGDSKRASSARTKIANLKAVAAAAEAAKAKKESAANAAAARALETRDPSFSYTQKPPSLSGNGKREGSSKSKAPQTASLAPDRGGSDSSASAGRGEAPWGGYSARLDNAFGGWSLSIEYRDDGRRYYASATMAGPIDGSDDECNASGSVFRNGSLETAECNSPLDRKLFGGTIGHLKITDPGGTIVAEFKDTSVPTVSASARSLSSSGRDLPASARLTVGQVRSTQIGQNLSGTTGTGKRATLLFSPGGNGTATFERPNGSEKKFTGGWNLRKDGSLCFQFEVVFHGERKCVFFQKSGDQMKLVGYRGGRTLFEYRLP